jgi:MerR family transcriptional regulator, light-induced transcriptional regulator
VYAPGSGAPRLVVATLPGQVHELGALMVAVTAAAEGWAVTYLGPDLPAADLASTAKETGARAVAVSVVYVADDGDVVSALWEARAALPPDVPLLLGGAAAGMIRLERHPPGIVVLDTLAELRAQLRRMAGAAAR